MRWTVRIFLVMLAVCAGGLVLAGCGAEDEDEVPAAEAVEADYSTAEVPDRFRVEITPSAESYEIPRDLGTVRNLDYFSELTEPQKRQLAELGFVVVPDDAEQMFLLYENYAESDAAANFITVDSMLQAWHVIFDYALRTVEQQHLAGLARRMTEALLAATEAQAAEAPEALEDSIRRNLAYFAVASRLLDPAAEVPDDVRELVDAELELIDAHQGRAQSPVMGTTVHYSQFVPRGHYTRSEELGRYFRALMWYGLVGFELEPDDPDVQRRHTRQALLLVKALAESQTARDAWERLGEPVELFVGAADDLSYAEYAPLAREVFGDALPLEELAAEAKLEEFIARAREKLPGPRIAPFFLEGNAAGEFVGGPKVQGRQFRVLGQRFIPDSWVLQQLVMPLVDRYVPMGLDVMAALGSQRAREILTGRYDQDRHAHYTQQLDQVTAEMQETPESVWRSNLYWGWLHALVPLLEPRGEGYPTFMHTDEWLDKQLSSSLASWAEMRHDTILYAKQSGAEGEAMKAAAPKGYVEPYPEVFARLAWLAWRSRQGLEERGILPESLEQPLGRLEETLLFLKSVAEKELTGEPRTAEEYERIQYFGGELERLTLQVTEGGERAAYWFEIENQTGRNLACIADVHTFFDRVLEVGVGPAYRIYVVVPHPDGDLQIARGGCFSYWEFHWPASDRLTDEKWQAMLASGEAPARPEWTESFVVPGGPPHQP